MTKLAHFGRKGQEPASHGARSTMRPVSKRRNPPPDEGHLRARLASNVKRLRRLAKLTQEQAAEAAEIHPREWQKIEAAEVNVTLAVLVKVAMALDVAPVELLERPRRNR